MESSAATPGSNDTPDGKPGGPWIHRILAPPIAATFLVTLSVPLIFYGLGSYSLVNGDEALYHDVALNIVESGVWSHLRSGPEVIVYDIFMKAPLQYWARALTIQAIGDSMWSVRILSASFALLTVLMAYRCTLHVGGRLAAFVAGLALLSNYQFLYLHSARTGELEPWICFFLVAAAYLFIRCIENPERSLLPHHLCLLMVSNLKLPLVLVPVGAELLCFVLLPQSRGLFRCWLGIGIAILPIAFCWHVWQAAVMWDEMTVQLARMKAQALGRIPKFRTATAWQRAFVYTSIVNTGTFPWAPVYLIAATYAAWESSTRRRYSTKAGQARSVLLAYTVALFAFVITIGKVGKWYVIPAYPFLSILTGLWIARLAQQRPSRGLLLAIAAALTVVVSTRVPMWNINPLATPAFIVPMKTEWWIDSLPAALAIVGTLAAALLYARRRWPETLGRSLAICLVALLSTYGWVRIVPPLAKVDRQSRAAVFRARIEERVDTRQGLRYPIPLVRGHPWILRYYYGHDFEIRPPLYSVGSPRYRVADRFLYPMRAADVPPYPRPPGPLSMRAAQWWPESSAEIQCLAPP